MNRHLTCQSCGQPATHRAGRRPLCDRCMAQGATGRRRRARFDPDRPHALVLVDPTVCPSCAGPAVVEVARQDALLRHGGHGATLRVERRVCRRCGWSVGPFTAEERPPR